MQTTRCPACGLTQAMQNACKRCGNALAPTPTPPRRAARVPSQPSRLWPYLTIWTQPRATIRGIVDDDPTRAVILLAWISGIADSLESAMLRTSGAGLPWAAVVVIACFIGPVVGFARVYVGALLVAMTGRWLGGNAGVPECRTALAWGSLPQIAALILWIPVLAIFGNEIFNRDAPRIASSPVLLAALVVFAVLWTAASVWASVLKWKGLAEVHGFSAWRGFFTTALAGMLVLTFLLGLVLVALKLDILPAKRPASPAGALSADVAWVTA
jgi:hypothetical protein